MVKLARLTVDDVVLDTCMGSEATEYNACDR